MKNILIMLVVLGALIAVAFWKRTSNQQKTNSAKLVGAPSRELLLPDLKSKANDIRKARITDGDKKVNLALAGEKWTVAERDGFPAAFEKLAKLVGDLADLKVAKKDVVGKTALGDVKLDLPSGKAEDPKGGVLLEFLDEKDAAIASIVLGANRQSTTVGQQQQMFGGGSNERVVRVLNSQDGDTVWWVNNQFSDLSAKAEDWIDKSFIDVQNIRSVEVTTAKAEDNWKASRKDVTADFALDGGIPGDELDNSKASLSSLLATASFNDVLTKEQAKPDFMKGATKAKITTFDGFTYDLLLLKKGEASDEKHYMSVAVTADIPQTRTPEKDEKEEDKKTKDEEFANKKKELEEKLAKAKAAEGWVYDVSSYVLGSLMKPKAEVLKSVTVGEANADGSTSVKATVTPQTESPAAPATPAEAPAEKKPISVTTPPVAVPPLPNTPKTEITPAPPADANPATGEPAPKPAADPAPAEPKQP
jgi:hypothetical protein